MYAAWLKKIICFMTLSPFSVGILTFAAPVNEAAQQETVREIQTENDLTALEERFANDSQFDAKTVNAVLQLRAIEAGSLVPMRQNIDAMLLLWDADVRDPHVYVATLLKGTHIEQSLLVNLYGPEVSALLSELNGPEGQELSPNAQLIQDAFQTVNQK